MRYYFQWLLLLLIVFSSAIVSGWWGYHLIFRIPEVASIATIEPEKQVSIVADNQNTGISCVTFAPSTALDNNGHLSLLVWNIYKQQLPDWEQELTHLTQSSQLTLLQEVSATPSFILWLNQQELLGQQAKAFDVFENSVGVMNVAKHYPNKVCAMFENEPWLQLPKSALFALYPLSNGTELLVANIHAVNFSFGIVELKRQLDQIKRTLDQHNGPIIFAGDFNTWSDERMALVSRIMHQLALRPVIFTPDLRTQFGLTELPLDHVFYRGLKVTEQQVIQSSVSDHNPLHVEFVLP